MPERIQRRRVKGWRMPDNTVNCTRPGPWANPFKVGGWFKMGDAPGYRGPFRMSYSRRLIWKPEDHDSARREGYTLIRDATHAVQWFRRYLEAHPRDMTELRGKNLACWCALDKPCHVDVLLEMANSSAAQTIASPPG